MVCEVLIVPQLICAVAVGAAAETTAHTRVGTAIRERDVMGSLLTMSRCYSGNRHRLRSDFGTYDVMAALFSATQFIRTAWDSAVKACSRRSRERRIPRRYSRSIANASSL